MKHVAYLALTIASLWAQGRDGSRNGRAGALYVPANMRKPRRPAWRRADAPGYALAARSVLADEVMHAPCLECLERAETYSRKAIAADPKYPEGHIYLAVTFGYEARIIGVIEARIKGFAEQAKNNLDAVIAVEPNNPWALAGLGGWNIEIVRSAGESLASWTL
jgi:hypothetical protein